MRTLEDHLSPHELASLPESAEALESSGPDQQLVRQHLQQCEVCSGLAQAHWNLLGLRAQTVSATDSQSCYPEGVWLEFAAGLRPDQASSLLAHSATCTSCANALREAMMLMPSDQLDEAGTAAEPIEGLASSTPEWQSRVAAQMMSAASASVKPPKTSSAAGLTLVQRARRQAIWITLPVAAAILLAVTLSGVAVWRFTHPSEARLLALAYNKQRTMALRIPGGDPVPLASGTRGSASGISDTSELLELRLRAQQHLDQVPNSPYWHQVLGEVDLLEQDGMGARRNFEIAETTDENLANLELDLAAAWFEIGDKTGNAEAYAQAAELYSKQLHDHPSNPALLYYNRALCWERQNLNENALDDLRAALPLERSSVWRKAIEDEIARLNSHSANTPTDGYEAALGDATVNLLPHWTDSPDARAKLAQVAALGLRHHDRWLQDWIAANHSSKSIEADQQLAIAVADGSAGKAQSSLAEAQKAVELYTSSSQRPGIKRAQLTELFALQRLGRNTDCISSAADLEADRVVESYSRMQVQALLDQGACKGRLGDFVSAQSDFAKADALSKSYDLPLSDLTAVASQVDADREIGMTSAAWQRGVSGLQNCSHIVCPAGRKYAVLYNLVICARDLGLSNVAAEVMRTAEGLAAASGNATTHAFAVETLAKLTGRVGDYSSSYQEFAHAFEIAQTADRAKTVKLYQALWQTDQAEVLTRQGSANAALNLLNQSAPAVLESDYEPGRVNYYRQLAATQFALGRDEALANAQTAVREAELSLVSLRSTLEREQWARENAPVYAELVSIYLRRGESTEALRVWESFRTAPYRANSAGFAGVSPPVAPVGAQVIVVARIDQSYVGWLAVAQPLKVLQTVVLGDQAHLSQSATGFYRLCADRDSAIGDIRSVGAQLYTELLGPFRGQPGTLDHLRIELDPTLSMLPLAALVTSDGGWLGDSARISVLAPWWSINPVLAMSEPQISPVMHLVAISGIDQIHSSQSEVGPIANLFAGATQVDGISVSQPQLVAALASAEVFHFSGHANSSEGARLLLATRDSAGQFSLTPEVINALRLPHCRLAVLAACNTTSADPDQIEKLPDVRNALLLSGTQSVIASNWDVDDSSTRSLMLALYRQLVRGRSPSQALQMAQQTIHSTAAWQHPYYWAAFEDFTN